MENKKRKFSWKEFLFPSYEIPKIEHIPIVYKFPTYKCKIFFEECSAGQDEIVVNEFLKKECASPISITYNPNKKEIILIYCK